MLDAFHVVCSCLGTKVTKGETASESVQPRTPQPVFSRPPAPPPNEHLPFVFFSSFAAAEEFAAEPAAHVCAAPQASKISGRRSRPRPVPRKAAPRRGKRLKLLAHRRRRGGRRMLERRVGGGGGSTAVMACSWRIPPSRVFGVG